MKALPFKTAILFPWALFFLGCASAIDYRIPDKLIDEGDCSRAANYFDENRDAYGINNRLNYLFDSAITSLRCKDFHRSNDFLHQAEEYAEKLWTKSLTREAASFLLNDYTIPYSGEDFERVMVNLFSAINYSMLGDIEGALVECRRLDSLLTMYNDKYDKKNIYKEDAFARYLSGILYEADDNIEDAYIAYYKALNTYLDYERNYGTAVPQILKEDIVRVARLTDRFDELKEILPEFEQGEPDPAEDVEVGKKGKVVIIHLNGRSPVKREENLLIQSASGPITMAFPRYEVSPPLCSQSRLYLESGSVGKIEKETELAEDINGIALKNLEDRKGRVLAKTIARAVVKQTAINRASDDKSVQVLFNFLNAVIERADTRSWRTLPGEVRMTRVYADPGHYRAYAGGCSEKEILLESFYLEKGETRFLLYDTM